MNSDFLVSSDSMDSSDDPSNEGVLLAENQLEDACPPKESLPPKDGGQIRLPNLLDWGFDQDPLPADLDALCPDAEYTIPLCCSGKFDGRTAGLCIPCMSSALFYFCCSLVQFKFRRVNDKNAD